MEEVGKEPVQTNHGTSKRLNLWLFMMVLAWTNQESAWNQATFCAETNVTKQLIHDEDHQRSSGNQPYEDLRVGEVPNPNERVNFSNQNFDQLNVEVTLVEPFNFETISNQWQDESETTFFHSHVNWANQFMTNLLEFDLWNQGPKQPRLRKPLMDHWATRASPGQKPASWPTLLDH